MFNPRNGSGLEKKHLLSDSGFFSPYGAMDSCVPLNKLTSKKFKLIPPKHIYLCLLGSDEHGIKSIEKTASCSTEEVVFGMKSQFKTIRGSLTSISKSGDLLISDARVVQDLKNINQDDVIHIFVHGDGQQMIIKDNDYNPSKTKYSVQEFYDLFKPYLNPERKGPYKIHLASCYAAGSDKYGIALEDSFALRLSKIFFDNGFDVEIIARRGVSSITSDGAIESLYIDDNGKEHIMVYDSTYSFVSNIEERVITVSCFDPGAQSYVEVESIEQRQGYTPLK